MPFTSPRPGASARRCPAWSSTANVTSRASSSTASRARQPPRRCLTWRRPNRPLVNRSVAQLDDGRKLNPKAIRETCGQGRPGSKALQIALNSYIPQLARTKSDLEDEYLSMSASASTSLCRRSTPWSTAKSRTVIGRELGLSPVELDGGGNHSSASQRHRDQRKALKLRSHGLTVVRYSEDQVFNSPEQVATDTLAQLEQRRKLRS